MILKRKVSDLDKDIVPTKTATIDSSHSQEEISVDNEEKKENNHEDKGKRS